MIFSQACRRLHNGGTLDVDMSLFDTVNLPYQFSWIVSTHEIKNSTNIFHHVFTCTDYSMNGTHKCKCIHSRDSLNYFHCQVFNL